MDWVPLVAGVGAELRVFPKALAVTLSLPPAVGCSRCGQCTVRAFDRTSLPMCCFPNKKTRPQKRTLTQNGPRAPPVLLK